MKPTLKMTGIFGLGLLIAVIIYPILHESGHSIAALAVGAEVISFELLPLPNIMCNISGVNSLGVALIGIGGMLFPLLISLVLRPNNFWLWYCNTVIRGISILALSITFVATVMFIAGNPVANEDITSVLSFYSDAGMWVLLVSFFLIVCLCLRIARENPIKKVVAFFEI